MQESANQGNVDVLKFSNLEDAERTDEEKEYRKIITYFCYSYTYASKSLKTKSA